MPPEMWELLKTYGTAALPLALALMGYFGERADRKEAQGALVKVLQDQLQVARERTAVDQTGNQVIAALVGKLTASKESGA